ncbi:helix-turn-helix transcriptional regulator [Actinophytocola oryzae]|nr:helix-turn-helix transcriptional regulator [Actinophytocola oryzae]
MTSAATRYWRSDDVSAAARMLSEVDGPVAAAYRAGLMLLDGRTASALAEADRVLRDRTAPRAAVIPALATAVVGASLSGRFDRVWVAIGQAGPAQWELALIGYVQCFSLVLAGQVGDARVIAENGHRAAVADGNAAATAGWSMLRGVVENARGDLAAAVASLDVAVGLLGTHDPYRMLAPCLSWLASARAVCGERTEAQHTLRLAAEAPVGRLFIPLSGLSQAWVTAAGGDTTLAARQADAAADVAMAHGQFAVEAVARYDVARLGDPQSAHRRLATLAGVVQGRLAPTMAAAAAALARADVHGLDRAAAAFTSLGFDLLAAEATTAAAAIRNQRAVPTAFPHAATPLLRLTPALAGLTRRERDVALLVADGMTSSAIGRRLRLSARTVDNCLGRVYQKLGVASRRDVVPLVRRPNG